MYHPNAIYYSVFGVLFSINERPHQDNFTFRCAFPINFSFQYIVRLKFIQFTVVPLWQHHVQVNTRLVSFKHFPLWTECMPWKSIYETLIINKENRHKMSSSIASNSIGLWLLKNMNKIHAVFSPSFLPSNLWHLYHTHFVSSKFNTIVSMRY